MRNLVPVIMLLMSRGPKRAKRWIVKVLLCGLRLVSYTCPLCKALGSVGLAGSGRSWYTTYAKQ